MYLYRYLFQCSRYFKMNINDNITRLCCSVSVAALEVDLNAKMR